MGLKKIISVATALIFIFNAFCQTSHGVVSAHRPVHIYDFSDDFNISSYESPGKTKVILIQDLHCHYDTQLKISNFLSRFSEKSSYGLYVEGASEKINRSIIKNIPENVKKPIIEFLLEEGKISGSEHFFLTSDNEITVYGLEDPDLYSDNGVRLSYIYATQDEVSRIVYDMEEALNKLRKEKLGISTRKTLRMYDKYENAKIPQKAYYKYLLKEARKKSINTDNYGQIVIANSPDVKINYKKLNYQLQEYMSKAKGMMPYAAYTEFIKDDYLKKISEVSIKYNIDISAYTELAKYLEAGKLADSINLLALYSEENKLLNEILFKDSTKNERDVIVLSAAFNKFKRFMVNKATDSDSKYIDELNLSVLENLWGRHLDKEMFQEIMPYASIYKDYYDINSRRNIGFAEKILSGIDSFGGKESTIVAVTGGFHTEELKQLILDKGISVFVLTPKISGKIKEAEEKYKYLFNVQEDTDININLISSYALKLFINNGDKSELIRTFSEVNLLYRNGGFGNQSLEDIVGRIIEEYNKINSDNMFFEDIKKSGESYTAVAKTESKEIYFQFNEDGVSVNAEKKSALEENARDEAGEQSDKGIPFASMFGEKYKFISPFIEFIYSLPFSTLAVTAANAVFKAFSINKRLSLTKADKVLDITSSGFFVAALFIISVFSTANIFLPAAVLCFSVIKAYTFARLHNENEIRTGKLFAAGLAFTIPVAIASAFLSPAAFAAGAGISVFIHLAYNIAASYVKKLNLPVAAMQNANKAKIRDLTKKEQEIFRDKKKLYREVGESEIDDTVGRIFEKLLDSLYDVNEQPVASHPRLIFFNSPEVNAFFLVNSRVVCISSALITRMYRIAEEKGMFLAEDHIAAVLAHELGHSKQKIQKKGSIIFSTGQSEKIEYDADLESAKILARAGYNPEAVADVMQFLIDMHNSEYDSQAGESVIGSLFSTHPHSQNRLSNLRKNINSADDVLGFAKERPYKRMVNENINFLYESNPEEAEVVGKSAYDTMLNKAVKGNIFESISQIRHYRGNNFNYKQFVSDCFLSLYGFEITDAEYEVFKTVFFAGYLYPKSGAHAGFAGQKEGSELITFLAKNILSKMSDSQRKALSEKLAKAQPSLSSLLEEINDSSSPVKNLAVDVKFEKIMLINAFFNTDGEYGSFTHAVSNIMSFPFKINEIIPFLYGLFGFELLEKFENNEEYNKFMKGFLGEGVFSSFVKEFTNSEQFQELSFNGQIKYLLQASYIDESIITDLFISKLEASDDILKENKDIIANKAIRTLSGEDFFSERGEKKLKEAKVKRLKHILGVSEDESGEADDTQKTHQENMEEIQKILDDLEYNYAIGSIVEPLLEKHKNFINNASEEDILEITDKYIAMKRKVAAEFSAMDDFDEFDDDDFDSQEEYKDAYDKKAESRSQRDENDVQYNADVVLLRFIAYLKRSGIDHDFAAYDPYKKYKDSSKVPVVLDFAPVAAFVEIVKKSPIAGIFKSGRLSPEVEALLAINPYWMHLALSAGFLDGLSDDYFMEVLAGKEHLGFDFISNLSSSNKIFINKNKSSVLPQKYALMFGEIKDFKVEWMNVYYFISRYMRTYKYPDRMTIEGLKEAVSILSAFNVIEVKDFELSALKSMQMTWKNNEIEKAFVKYVCDSIGVTPSEKKLDLYFSEGNEGDLDYPKLAMEHYKYIYYEIPEIDISQISPEHINMILSGFELVKPLMNEQQIYAFARYIYMMLKEKNMLLNVNTGLDYIDRLTAGYSPLKDEMLYDILEIFDITPVQYSEIQSKMMSAAYKDPKNETNSVFAGLRTYNVSVAQMLKTEKKDLLLWLISDGKFAKPANMLDLESKHKVSFDGYLDIFKNLTKIERKEFIDTLMLNRNGILEGIEGAETTAGAQMDMDLNDLEKGDVDFGDFVTMLLKRYKPKPKSATADYGVYNEFYDKLIDFALGDTFGKNTGIAKNLLLTVFKNYPPVRQTKLLNELIGVLSKVDTENMNAAQKQGHLINAVASVSGPAVVKVMQILSTQKQFENLEGGKEINEIVSQLKDSSDPISKKLLFELFKQNKVSNIGSIGRTLGSASIAQVNEVNFTKPVKGHKRAAVKTLRSTVVSQMEEDYAVLERLLDYITGEVNITLPTALQIRNIIEEEKNFASEAAANEILQQNMAKRGSAVRMPEILMPVTEKSAILVQEFIEGASIDKVLEGSDKKVRNAVAMTIVREFFEQVFIDGYFHADLHTGNVLADRTGKLVFIDAGAVGRISDNKKMLLEKMFAALVNVNPVDIIKKSNYKDFVKAVSAFDPAVGEKITSDKEFAEKLQALFTIKNINNLEEKFNSLFILLNSPGYTMDRDLLMFFQGLSKIGYYIDKIDNKLQILGLVKEISVKRIDSQKKKEVAALNLLDDESAEAYLMANYRNASSLEDLSDLASAYFKVSAKLGVSLKNEIRSFAGKIFEKLKGADLLDDNVIAKYMAVASVFGGDMRIGAQDVNIGLLDSEGLLFFLIYAMNEGDKGLQEQIADMINNPKNDDAAAHKVLVIANSLLSYPVAVDDIDVENLLNGDKYNTSDILNILCAA